MSSSLFRIASTCCVLALASSLSAFEVLLPLVVVMSPRVANQDPSGTFSAPLTALRYEPLVDVQGRNFAEGQADVSIRGGTFENTGFSIGGLPIYDPQTGHYSAELPVAPAMLSAPKVVVGADAARSSWNATAGSVGYAWKPIASGGSLAAAAGDNHSLRGDLYLGAVSDVRVAGQVFAADVAVAHSESDGTRPYGDHDFDRYSARLQLAGDSAQTDLFAGYQTKFIGWQNLYARSNLFETDDLETTLVALNHRVTYGAGGDFFQAGAYYRRNVDEYILSRLNPALFRANHTTEVFGAALDGRLSFGERSVADSASAPSASGGRIVDAIRYRAGVIADDLTSTALNFGRFHSRTQVYAGVFPEKTFVIDAADARSVLVSAGAAYDDTNRNRSAVSPVAEISLLQPRSALRRVTVSYAESSQLPTYTALNSNSASGLFRGNRDLGRSSARNVELAAHAVASGWDVTSAIFLRQDDDLVDWTYNSALALTAARSAAAVDLDTTGFELVAQRSFARVDLVFGYTWLHKDADYGSTSVDASFYALNFPEHRLTAAIVARLGAGFELRLDNEARIQADNVLRRTSSDVVISALGVYYRPQISALHGLVFSAQVDNLWDADFEEVPLVPGSPRAFSIGATYSF